MPVNVLHDTGRLMSCMTKRFFDTLPIKPKLIPCDGYISGMGGKALKPVGECFIQLQIAKRVFRERVVVINILGKVLHRSYQFGTEYSTAGKYYITINGQVIAQAISKTIDYPIIKTEGMVTLLPMSVSTVEVKTPKIPSTTNLYELNADTFQLLLDILDRFSHKNPQHLNIPILNAKNVLCSIGKNMPIASMWPVGKCDEAQEVSWS